MRRLTILFSALTVVLAACAGSGDETTTTAGTDDPATSAASDAPTTTSSTETTTTARDTTTTSGDSATGTDDCVVGTWTLDDEAFVENFGSVFEEAGMPNTEVTALDGTFTVELGADGSLRGTREDWGFNIATGEGTVILEINGTETGTWAADGSKLTVNIDESDLEISSSFEVDGEVIEMPQDQIPVDTPPGIASNSEYTCSGDTLILTNAGVESVLNRS